MEKYYHGAGQRGPYFEGWYLKHQTREGAALALIPACHIDLEGRRGASLQIVADGQAWWLAYPDAEFRAFGEMFCVRVGQSLFTRREMCLHIERDELSLHGTVRCGPFTPLRSDIMGRTVRESLRSTVGYRFWAGETLLLDRTDRCAGFEYAEKCGIS